MGVWEPAFVTLVVYFFEFLTPSTLRGHNFFNSISFLTFFSALNMPIGGLQVLFRHQKQWIVPLGSGLFWTLKCYSCNSIIINEQLKDLTHMFCFQIPWYKLYKEGLLSYVLTLKYMCHFGMSWKKHNLKTKHKIKENISWICFSAFNLMFFTYLPTQVSK